MWKKLLVTRLLICYQAAFQMVHIPR